MECKNCSSVIDTRVNFCPVCGAKVIKKRLSLKSIWNGINHEFFNLDNKLFKTFIHLFTKPELVINSFIDGTRKRYISVIQYFAIALTFVGLQVFLMETFFADNINADSSFFDGLNKARINEDNPFKDTPANEFNKYLSIFYTISIPISAIATWAGYRIAGNRRFNFTEHIVLNLYYSAETIIISAVVTILLLSFGIDYMLLSLLTGIFTLLYFFYVLKRIFETSWLQTCAYYLMTMVAFGVIFIVILLLMFILGFAYGYFF